MTGWRDFSPAARGSLQQFLGCLARAVRPVRQSVPRSAVPAAFRRSPAPSGGQRELFGHGGRRSRRAFDGSQATPPSDHPPALGKHLRLRPPKATSLRSSLLAELAKPDTIGYGIHFADVPFGRVDLDGDLPAPGRRLNPARRGHLNRTQAPRRPRRLERSTTPSPRRARRGLGIRCQPRPGISSGGSRWHNDRQRPTPSKISKHRPRGTWSRHAGVFIRDYLRLPALAGEARQPFGSVPMFYAQTCAMPKLRRPHPDEPGMGRTGRCRPGNATVHLTIGCSYIITSAQYFNIAGIPLLRFRRCGELHHAVLSPSLVQQTAAGLITPPGRPAGRS